MWIRNCGWRKFSKCGKIWNQKMKFQPTWPEISVSKFLKTAIAAPPKLTAIIKSDRLMF